MCSPALSRTAAHVKDHDEAMMPDKMDTIMSMDMNQRMQTAQSIKFSFWRRTAFRFKAATGRYAAARRKNETRRVLSKLDNHLLRDIGIDPAAIGKRHETGAFFEMIKTRA